MADLVERRVSDVDKPLLHDLALVAVEEREEQSADVGAVDVGVGHQDDSVVSELRWREFVALESETEAGDECLDLRVLVHRGVVGLLDVEDLPAQRQDGLRLARSPLLGGATRRVSLDDENLRFRGVAGRAVGELARKDARAEHALAPHEIARRLGRLRRLGRRHRLVDDESERLWPTLQVVAQLLGHQLAHNGANLRVAQPVLGLALELRLAQADAHHGAEALAHELPGQRRLFLPQLVRGASEAVDDFGDGGLEALDVRAAVWRVDAVGEAE
mmetsp:Transcript_57679/g.125258  ORF Transcript_57679/g.125258 Transcript_57679/m.125258 type:complete len:274 (+) Transcript_57679:746-1567(+)